MPPNKCDENRGLPPILLITKHLLLGVFSVSFWLAVWLLTVWQESALGRIDQTRKLEWERVWEARAALQAAPEAASFECHDGWISTSRYGGVCSHHGGVKQSFVSIRRTAKADPDYKAELTKSGLYVQAWILALLAVTVGRAADRLFLSLVLPLFRSS